MTEWLQGASEGLVLTPGTGAQGTRAVMVSSAQFSPPPLSLWQQNPLGFRNCSFTYRYRKDCFTFHQNGTQTIERQMSGK